MIRRLSTWLSTGKSGPVDETTRAREVFAEVRSRVHRLEIALDELRDQHAALKLQHERLRGRMTGGLRGQQKGLDDIPFGDKEALRARAGLSLVRTQPTGE